MTKSASQEATLRSNRGLLRASSLLTELFPNEQDRPSRRWLERMNKRRVFPSIKAGGLRLYDPAAVRAALEAYSTSSGERAKGAAVVSPTLHAVISAV